MRPTPVAPGAAPLPVDEPGGPDALRRALAVQLAGADVEAGIAAALDILAGPPRIKPSRGLLVDPGDSAATRWAYRVAAAAALLASPAATRVADELVDELLESRELAADVLAGVHTGEHLDALRRAVQARLG